ncbi:MAG: cyclopropane-fatty-acyl-phospholipid synthase [Rhodobacteraceae bacterium]|nr:cyclopropane-fatty-acyl-phospholipid synthase [Paracoccaceae bacterium]
MALLQDLPKKYFCHLAQTLIRQGRLEVTFPDGSERHFGEQDCSPVKIRIHDEATLRRLCINPDLVVGEAYMDEKLTIENDELYRFLELVTKNISGSRDVAFRRFVNGIRTALRFLSQRNPVGRSRQNVKHHYDLSDELYELFLDADRQYSCAYFEHPEASLEEAQIAKKKHIARKLLLQPGMSVLDIGSGWGGMGLTLAKDHGCKVQGVTLSSGQHSVSNLRARDEGVANRANFTLMDYRDVKSEFDRIVSVGMFEHVGAPHYREFFRSMRRLLKEDGVALLHTIGRTTPPGSTNPWITKYIFPGGYIPAMSEVTAAIEREGLIVTDVEVLRLHYAETLKNWHERFLDNIKWVRELYDERFCRMWRFYLIACEVGFRHAGQVVFQFQISRNVGAVPTTRNYLYDLT